MRVVKLVMDLLQWIGGALIGFGASEYFAGFLTSQGLISSYVLDISTCFVLIAIGVVCLLVYGFLRFTVHQVELEMYEELVKVKTCVDNEGGVL